MKLASTFLLACLVACSSAGGDDNGGNVCGDNVQASAEQCDDGNTVSGDGCSATCRDEFGGMCGNMAVDTGETCDDGNTTDGDGCSSTCQDEGGTGAGTCAAPYTLTLTASGTDFEGTATGDTSGSTDQVTTAVCDEIDSGAGKDHVWEITIGQTSDLYILIDENVTMFDSVIRVMSSPCDASSEVPEFTGADGCADGEGASEFLGYTDIPAGTYYILVDGFEAADGGMYKLDVLVTAPKCMDGTLDPLEFCDDGNTTNGDGCSGCEVDDGYTCDFASPSVCTMDTASETPAPGDLVINEFMAADGPTEDTNCDSSTTGTADEFIEIYNASSKMLDLGGVTIADSVVDRHVFGAMKLPAGQAVVVWNAGTPMCTGVTMFDVASSGQLGLNDGGDTISLKLNGADLATVTYGAVTIGTSKNLSPDLTGTAYVDHTAVSGAVGKYTPGKKANGTAF